MSSAVSLRRWGTASVAGVALLAACSGSGSAVNSALPAEVQAPSTPTLAPNTAVQAPATEAPASPSSVTTDASSSDTANRKPSERIVVDWQGRDVLVPAEPQRVIALSPTPAMNLAILGFDVIALPVDLSDSLNEEFQAFIPDGTNIDGYEVIGINESLNLEALARLQPDLIIGDARLEQSEPTAFGLLSEIAPTVLVETGTNAEWRANFERDAEIVGALDRTEEVEAIYESALGTLVDAGDTSIAFVRYEINGGGTWRLEGAETSVPGSIMIDAGVNVFEGPDGIGELNATGSFIPNISGELLGLLTADVIVVQDLTQFGQNDPLELFAGNPLWQTLPAVTNGRVVTLPTFVFNGGTYVSAIQTIEQIAAAL